MKTSLSSTKGIEMPNKSEIAALEKVWIAEVEDRLPFQSKAKIYKQLLDDGLVQENSRSFGSGWSAITVSGYALTHAGRLLYCSRC